MNKQPFIQFLQDIFGKRNTENFKVTLIKDGIWSLVINGANKALVLIIGVLMIRILGRAQYGTYSYFLSLVMILIIPVEYGISNLIVRETAQAASRKEPDAIMGIWRWSLRITLLVSSSVIAIAILLAMTWGKSALESNQLQTLLWGLPLLFFQSLVHLSSAALRGMKKIILGQLPDLLIIPALFILLFLFGWSLWPGSLTSSSAMAIRSIATFVALLFSIVFLFQKTPLDLLKTTPVYEGRKWLASVMPLGLSSGLNMVKNHASVLIMGFFVTAAKIGSYQVAVSTAALAALVLHTLNTLLAPQFASFFAQDEHQKLQKLVTISSRVAFVFNLILTIIFVLFGKAILAFVFGADTVDAYPALLVLLAGQLVNSFMGSVAFLLNMTGHETDVMKVIGLSTILNVLITLLFTPLWDIVGAAFANAISLIFAQITLFVIVRKRIGIVSNVVGKLN